MDLLSQLDGFAGFAALVNSLVMWPTLHAIKKFMETTDKRLTDLERSNSKSDSK